MIIRLLRLTVLLLTTIPFFAQASDDAGLPSPEQQKALQAIGAEHADFHYSGRLAEAVDQLVAHPAAQDAQGKFMVGNMIWSHDPDRSRQLHEEAAELAPDDPNIRFEQALQDTRAENCDRAVGHWRAMRAGAGIPPQASYVAAYCFLRQKEYSMALSIVRDSEVSARHVAAEKLSHSVFGGPATVVQFDREYRAARAGDRAGLESAIVRAFEWEDDWWNAGPNPHAQKSVRTLMQDTWPEDSRERREWDCLWEDLLAGKSLSADRIAECKVLVGDHPYPASSALGWLLVSRSGPDQLRAILDRHGGELKRRAENNPGDLTALRVLAHLQATTGDRNGLAQSDQLGWKRYGESRFRLSAVVGATGQADFPGLLAKALKEAPNDPLLVFLDARSRYPEGHFPTSVWADLICAETRSLEMSRIIDRGMRSHSQIRAFYAGLAESLGDPAHPGGGD